MGCCVSSDAAVHLNRHPLSATSPSDTAMDTDENGKNLHTTKPSEPISTGTAKGNSNVATTQNQDSSSSSSSSSSPSSSATSTPSAQNSNSSAFFSDPVLHSQPVSHSSLPHNPLNVLKEEVQKFPQLDKDTQETLRDAVDLLEGLKKKKGYVGTFFSIVHSVVSGIHNANGEVKKDCLQLINKVNRIIAGPNAEFVNNPPRNYVSTFREVLLIAKEAKLLIAKFIPVTKEDDTFLSTGKHAMNLFTGCKNEFKLLHKRIDEIHSEIASALQMSTVASSCAAAQPTSLPPRPRKIEDLSSPSAGKQFIEELQESCRSWYDTKFELEIASNSPSKQIIKLENLYVDLKIQRQVNASSIAENAAGEHADLTSLHKHLFFSEKKEGNHHHHHHHHRRHYTKLIIIEGPAGCGKTTCCQEFTRRQTIEGAIVIFIALKDLFECGRVSSIEDILSFIRAPSSVRLAVPEILKYDIPIVWILDGFDEVMLTDDGGVRNFLHNFVDPATRRRNLKDKFLPHLIRACDAVIISSRENRVDNKDVVAVNGLKRSLAPDFWVIQRWQRDAISKYIDRHFQKSGNTLSVDELKQIVDATLSPEMQGFHGIPLFIKLLCDAELEDPKLDISKVTPPYLYQKSLRQAFNRADLRIGYLLNQNASWMRYSEEKYREKLFLDIVLPNASKRAFDEFLLHQGTALTFKVSDKEETPLWSSVMLEMGILQRDDKQFNETNDSTKETENSFKFPHRTFIEFLAAKHVALNPTTALPLVPFKDELNTTWLLICQLANERENDGFLSRLSSTGLTSTQLAKFIADQFVVNYHKVPLQDRRSNDEEKVSSLVSTLSLKLLIQIAVALPGDLMMDSLKSAHSKVYLKNAPSHFKWMIEWCGLNGAIKVLKWFERHYSSLVNPDETKDKREQYLIRLRCRLGLARALQVAGGVKSSSSSVEECINFYVGRAGELEPEDAVAADSHLALQDVLKKKKWTRCIGDFSNFVTMCIQKRKSHPNLLASLLVFLRIDDYLLSTGDEYLSLLQLAFFIAPEKIEVQHYDQQQDSSNHKQALVEVVDLADELKKNQSVNEQFTTELEACEKLFIEIIENDDLLAAFAECQELDATCRVRSKSLMFAKTTSSSAVTMETSSNWSMMAAEDFRQHGFGRINCSFQVTDDILEKAISKFPSLKSVNLAFCDGITDAGVEHLLKLPLLETLDLGYCENIGDDALKHLSSTPALQTLVLEKCKNISDDGLEHLSHLCSHLETLDLSFCNEITKTGVQHISRLTSLRTLNLSACFHITDDALRSVATLSNLQHLQLQDCSEISDDGLEHLWNLKSLETLHIYNCENVTASGQREILKKIPPLLIRDSQ